MPIDRAAFNALVDDSGLGTDGSLWDKAAIEDVILDPIDRELPRIYSVIRYGAVGDGVTDDSGAIQDAIDAAVSAGGGIVWFPQGTYRIAATLTLGSNITLAGMNNASFIDVDLSANGVAVSCTSLTHIRIRDLTFDGTCSRVIALTVCSDVKILDCHISGATLGPTLSGVISGVNGRECFDVEIAGCKFDGNGYGASDTDSSADIIFGKATGGNSRINIHDNVCISTAVTMNVGVEDSAYCWVVDNYLANAVTSVGKTKWGYAVYFYLTGGGSLTDYNHITGNTCSDHEGTPIYLQAASFTLVDGNTIINGCIEQIPTELATGAIAGNNASANCVITNNIINGTTAVSAAGVRMDGPDCIVEGNQIHNAYSGVSIGNGAHGLQIKNNIIKGVTDGSCIITQSSGQNIVGVKIIGNRLESSVQGIGVDALLHLTIALNDILNCDLMGMVLSNCTIVKILDNDVWDNNQAAGSNDGIRVVSCARVKVRGNSSTGASQRYGISSNSCTGLRIYDNDLAGNGTGEYNDVSSTSPETMVAFFRTTDRVFATGTGKTVDNHITEDHSFGQIKQS